MKQYIIVDVEEHYVLTDRKKLFWDTWETKLAKEKGQADYSEYHVLDSVEFDENSIFPSETEAGIAKAEVELALAKENEAHGKLVVKEIAIKTVTWNCINFD